MKLHDAFDQSQPDSRALHGGIETIEETEDTSQALSLGPVNQQVVEAYLAYLGARLAHNDVHSIEVRLRCLREEVDHRVVRFSSLLGKEATR